MERIVVLGGGVGGTLTANLLARRLHEAITLGQVDITLVDASGAHVYQPGFMYIAMGGEREEKLSRRERGPPRRRGRPHGRYGGPG
jgi:sulfide:quinone oxidoreductase